MIFFGGIRSYVFWGSFVFVIGIFLFRLKTDKNLYEKKPFPSSIIALCLIVFNWILYLFDFYAVIPDQIGDMIFLPIWFLVCVIGLIATFKEYKNNLFIGLLAGGLSIINLMVGALLFLIGRM